MRTSGGNGHDSDDVVVLIEPSDTGNDPNVQSIKTSEARTKQWAEDKMKAAKAGLEQAFASKHKEVAALFEEADKELKKHADRLGTGPAARAEAFRQALSARLYSMISSIEQNVSRFTDPQKANLKSSQQEFVNTVTSSALDLSSSAMYDRMVEARLVTAIDLSQKPLNDLEVENIAKLNNAAAPFVLQLASESTAYVTSYGHLKEGNPLAYDAVERTRLRAQVINCQHEVYQAIKAAQPLMGTIEPPEVLSDRWQGMSRADWIADVSAESITNRLEELRQEMSNITDDQEGAEEKRQEIQETEEALNRITPDVGRVLAERLSSVETKESRSDDANAELSKANLTFFPANPAELREDYAVLRNAREAIQKQTYGDKSSLEHQLEIIDNAMHMNLVLQREVSLQKEAAVQSYINTLGKNDGRRDALQAEADAERMTKNIVIEYLMAAPILGKFTSARQRERLVAGLVGTFVGLTTAAGAWAATASIPALHMQGGGMAAAEAAAREAFTTPASVWERLSGIIASNQPIAGMDPSLFVSLVVVGSILGAVVFTAAVAKFAHDIEQGKQSGTLWGQADPHKMQSSLQITRLEMICKETRDQYTALYNSAQGITPL